MEPPIVTMRQITRHNFGFFSFYGICYMISSRSWICTVPVDRHGDRHVMSCHVMSRDGWEARRGEIKLGRTYIFIGNAFRGDWTALKTALSDRAAFLFLWKARVEDWTNSKLVEKVWEKVTLYFSVCRTVGYYIVGCGIASKVSRVWKWYDYVLCSFCWHFVSTDDK